jgi:hypothetical protein
VVGDRVERGTRFPPGVGVDRDRPGELVAVLHDRAPGVVTAEGGHLPEP